MIIFGRLILKSSVPSLHNVSSKQILKKFDMYKLLIGEFKVM